MSPWFNLLAPDVIADEARDAIRDNAAKLDQLLGVDTAWRFLYEVADELVTVAARERRL